MACISLVNAGDGQIDIHTSAIPVVRLSNEYGILIYSEHLVSDRMAVPPAPPGVLFVRVSATGVNSLSVRAYTRGWTEAVAASVADIPLQLQVCRMYPLSRDRTAC